VDERDSRVTARHHRVVHRVVHRVCCRITLYGIKCAACGGARDLTGLSGRDHDTARGPAGPCSVAARPDGHYQLGRRCTRHEQPEDPHTVPWYLALRHRSAGGLGPLQVPGIVLRPSRQHPGGWWCRCAMAYVPPLAAAEPSQRLAVGEEGRVRPIRVRRNPHCGSPGNRQRAWLCPCISGWLTDHRRSPCADE
jgi:hypothetical protein